MKYYCTSTFYRIVVACFGKNSVQLEEQIECSFSFYDWLQWNGFSVVWKFKSSATKSNESWEATTCTNFQPRITWYEAKMHRNFPQNAINSQNTSGKENLSTLINLVGRLPWYEWEMVVKRSQKIKNQLGFHTSNKKHFIICVKQQYLCFCSIFALAFVEIWLFLAARWRKFCHFAFPKIQIELHFPFSLDYRQHINSNLNSCGPVPQTHIWVWEILLLLFSKEGSGSILDQPDKEKFRYLTKIIVLPSSISHEIASLRLNKPFSNGRWLQKFCGEISLGWIWWTKISIHRLFKVREGFTKKYSCSFGFCPNEGGGRLPKFFVTFS